MKRRDEGSLIKHADGKRWIARLRYTDLEGNAREKKRTCLTHAKAKSMIDTLKSEIDLDSSDRKTFRELVSHYREHHIHAAKFVGGKKVSGFRQELPPLHHYLDVALAYFGDKWINEITYADLNNYKNEIAGTPTRYGSERSVASTNHYLKNLRRLLNVAIEQGWLDTSPFKRGGPLVMSSFEVERTRILSEFEEHKLLSMCKGRREHLRPLIIFAIETACRRGEIQAVKWENVNTAARSIRIEGTTTKTLKTRLVPVSSRLAETLAQLRHNQIMRLTAPIFGKAEFTTAFNSARAAADLEDVTFHDLRHTGTTRMIDKGIPIAAVMKITGHSQMKTFLRYVNQSEASVYEVALKLDRAA